MFFNGAPDNSNCPPGSRVILSPFLPFNPIMFPDSEIGVKYSLCNFSSMVFIDFSPEYFSLFWFFYRIKTFRVPFQ